MSKDVDYSLYLVTDRALAGDRPLEQVIEAAVRGGATVVQLREKGRPTDEFIALARRIRRLTRALGVPLIINDDIEVALAAQADGVHVGQSDTPWREARRRLGPGALIGLSVGTFEDLAAAEGADVDYLGIGPIFPTPTKTDTGPPWGLEGLRRARAASSRVLVAIGGIHVENASDVVRAGADGVAVVSALCAAPDVQRAAEALRTEVERGRQERDGFGPADAESEAKR